MSVPRGLFNASYASGSGPSPNMNRVPQDIDMSNRFQESAGSWSDPQAVPPVPPIPPRNYNATSCNTNMYSGNYNTMQPYYQRPYGGNYSMGMNGMNMNSYMYRNSYMNHGYPPQDNYFMPGGYMQMAQDFFSPVFQNSDHMISSLRDITYTADTALVSVRMLFEALNMVTTNLYRIKDFLQKYAVSFATLGSSHWIFHLIYKLLDFLGFCKKNQGSMDKIWNGVQGNGSNNPSMIANIMALSALITAFSYVLPKLVQLLQHVFTKGDPNEDTKTNHEDWNPREDNFTPVQAKYNFSAKNSSEINLMQGQQLRMKCLDPNRNELPLWVLVADSNFNKGYVPLSYLTLVR